MIVHDLDVFSPLIRPTKAEAKLIVNADAVLTSTVLFQGFQSIARRNPQIAELTRDLQLPQLASSDGRDIRESPDQRSLCKRLGLGALERLDHGDYSNATRDYWSRKMWRGTDGREQMATGEGQGQEEACVTDTWRVYSHTEMGARLRSFPE